MKAYIIGAGGIGSWLTPGLCLLIGKENVCVVDGDNLEPSNLNRQLFTTADLGKNKALALAEKYGCDGIFTWFSIGSLEIKSGDVLLVGVDNHPARLTALRTCDETGIWCVTAANERTSAEAYVYKRDWKDSNLDPRVIYPEMLTDKSGDPTSCTGLSQVQTPQLVSANMMAASLALHLFNVWHNEAPKLEPDVIPHLPHMLRQNKTRSESFKAQLKPKEQNEQQTDGRRDAVQ